MTTDAKPQKLPLWKSTAEKMIEAGLEYGQTFPETFFEEHLKCSRDTKEFAFEMLQLRQWIEENHGYYLKSSEGGKLWLVPQAEGHEHVAQTFDSKLRRYAVRSINLRSATLMNPKAVLTDEQRSKIESALERASVRLALISRAASVAKIVRKHASKLLE